MKKIVPSVFPVVGLALAVIFVTRDARQWRRVAGDWKHNAIGWRQLATNAVAEVAHHQENCTDKLLADFNAKGGYAVGGWILFVEKEGRHFLARVASNKIDLLEIPQRPSLEELKGEKFL